MNRKKRSTDRSVVHTLKSSDIKRWLPRRPKDTHKGLQGHVLVVAGSRDMSGAAVLCALGALRGGAGLVTVATPASVQAIVASQVPEVLTLPLPETSEGCLSERALGELEDYVSARVIHAVAMGPGLSVYSPIARIIKNILKNWDIPLVLDADGLNNVQISDLQWYPKLVITPHPAELGRLIGLDREIIKRERLHVAKNVAHDYGVTCVLKGYHTIVTDGKTSYINPTGNPAMATGGSGDVLTGIVAAFLAQRLPLLCAAAAGVYVHGLAGDIARVSDRGLLASEIAHAVPRALARLGVR